MKRKIELKVSQPVKIMDGLHKGVIRGVSERTEPYHYLDIEIEFTEEEQEKKIKIGYPCFVSTESKLGNLLARFGGDVSTPNTFIEPEPLLIGRECQFMTITEPGKDGKEYAKGIPESLKPC